MPTGFPPVAPLDEISIERSLHLNLATRTVSVDLLFRNAAGEVISRLPFGFTWDQALMREQISEWPPEPVWTGEKVEVLV